MYKYISLFYFIVISLLFTGCGENELSKVKEIELKQKGEVEVTKQAEIIYSDSAYVKAVLKAPILHHYKTNTPYYEMPNGIEVVFYDKNKQQTTKVTSDYAIQKQDQQIIHLKRNVVATNIKGDTFKSEELIWDEKLRRFYSNLPVVITTDKTDINGPGFWANESFTYYEITKASGVLEVEGDIKDN
jgi:LPS export ABC transporter protein LptC